jgi:hypothetical protein
MLLPTGCAKSHTMAELRESDFESDALELEALRAHCQCSDPVSTGHQCLLSESDEEVCGK